MDSEIVDVVTDWGSRSFAGGYDGLRELESEEFTGAVTEGLAWLFFLNGRIVGVFDGSLSDFETADGTAYDAPDPSLPLLFSMLETGGETKAQYYTEDTPMSSADKTLSSGSFTGYVELSENVLSGDYYVVYYGGRKLPCAFVGQSSDLVTGEEAFERAADEVGIYEVKDVDIEIVELPEAEDDEPADTETEDSESETTASAGTDAEESDVSVSMNGDGGTRREATGAAGASGSDAVEEPTDTERSGAAETDPTAEADPTAETDSTAETDPKTEAETANDTEPRKATETETEAAVTRRPDEQDRVDPAGGAEGGDSTAGVSDRPDAGSGEDSAPDAEDPDLASEQQWRNTRTIPSLDPDRSSTDGQPTGDHEESTASAGGEGGSKRRAGTAGGSGSSGGRSTGGSRSSNGNRSTSAGRSETSSSTSGGGRKQSAAGGSRSTTDAQVTKLRERVQTLETARDEARQQLQATESELESKTEEVEGLRSENERLESRVSELESEIDDLREQLAEVEEYVPDGDHEVSPADALSGTNLFVRYDSKGGETLETAHDETATRAEVEENMRIETHTDFEKAGAIVDGQSYEEFLDGRIEYQFVQWIVRDLLYEIQQTGTEGELKDLYDSIPELDRAELHGTVGIYDEEAEVDTERPFDVILRDRMGEPLVVANVTDSRDATRGPAVQELIDDARDVAEYEDTLGCAFYVTASFFEPGALEAVTEETGGGFLSRSKRESYVKLARKQGFHLSLVESREEGFHITVPEL